MLLYLLPNVNPLCSCLALAYLAPAATCYPWATALKNLQQVHLLVMVHLNE
jgi:hypothetical protein